MSDGTGSRVGGWGVFRGDRGIVKRKWRGNLFDELMKIVQKVSKELL